MDVYKVHISYGDIKDFNNPETDPLLGLLPGNKNIHIYKDGCIRVFIMASFEIVKPEIT